MRNTKQIPISNEEEKPKYDLEERTFLFAQNVRSFVKTVPRDISNVEDTKQLVRSSGSIGANYIEANECLGKKDFLMKIRIARKESKESIFWLRLIDTKNDESRKIRDHLLNESKELMLILSAIMRKSQ
ncbi:MAG TPA: four helix bundle protein [Candidatus Paceibacterota bacterium]